MKMEDRLWRLTHIVLFVFFVPLNFKPTCQQYMRDVTIEYDGSVHQEDMRSWGLRGWSSRSKMLRQLHEGVVRVFSIKSESCFWGIYHLYILCILYIINILSAFCNDPTPSLPSLPSFFRCWNSRDLPGRRCLSQAPTFQLCLDRRRLVPEASHSHPVWCYDKSLYC